MTCLILGYGFVGARAAARLAASGQEVIATVTDEEAARRASAAGAIPFLFDADDPGSRAALARRCGGAEQPLRVLVAFPPARRASEGERTAEVLEAISGGVARVVQISSTVVYGDARRIDEATVAAPANERGRLYLDAERAVRQGPWSSLVLRAAAIYGPGRGLLAEGGPRFSHARSLDAVVSRIHADDLAALAVAGLGAALEGAFPAADEEPASGRALLAAWAGQPWHPTAGADPEGSRRVDGRALARALGVRLRFPTYREALEQAGVRARR